MPITDLEPAAARVRRRLVPFLFLLLHLRVSRSHQRRLRGAADERRRSASRQPSTASAPASSSSATPLFEIPSNIILARVGARRWIARIMITWGLISAAMMFVHDADELLRAALPPGRGGGRLFPRHHLLPDALGARRASARATIATFMTATVTAGIVGGPMSGALLSLDGARGLAGWQWMFLLEGIPAVAARVRGAVSCSTSRRPDATGCRRRARRARVAAARRRARDRRRARALAWATRCGIAGCGCWRWCTSWSPVALYAFGFFLPQILPGGVHGHAASRSAC